MPGVFVIPITAPLLCYTYSTMGWLVRILLGALVSALGFLLVWKAEDAVGWFGGRSYWAEWNFGIFGGTSGMIKIIGIIVMFVGFGIMVQLQDAILGGIARTFIPGL